jgi:peptidoglycan/LPS O-acetylase OafA/YrhL
MRRSARGTLVGTGERLRFVEGLRGLAALYVVLGHFCSMVDPNVLQGKPSRSPEWLQALMSPFWYGHLAVACFIVLSGFCLQTSLFSSGSGRIADLKRFLSRRAWRILPPYYACLALSLVVATLVTPQFSGMPFEQYLPVTSENLSAHFLMIHNWSPDWMYKINGVLWSIAIEVQIYLVFPLLVSILVRAGRFWLVFLTTAVTVGCLLYWPVAIKLYPWYLALFALGMAAAHFAYRPPAFLGPRPNWAGWLSLPALIGCFATSYWGALMPIRDGLLGVALACGLYAGAVAPTLWPVRLLGIRPLASLGAVSYSLYLMHHPIQQTLFLFKPAWAVGPEMEMAFLAAVGLPVIMVACAGFWLLFERPFMVGRSEGETGANVYIPVSLPLKTLGEPSPVYIRHEVVTARVAEATVV